MLGIQRAAFARFAIFSTASLIAWIAPGPAIGIANGLLGGVLNGSAGRWVYVVTCLLLLLGITRVALRRDGESLATLGLVLDSRRLIEFGYGAAITSALFAAAALARALWIGATWSFEGLPGIRAALIGLPVAFLLMAGEELIFRGYGFRQLIAACGARTALVISALAFGVYHLAQTGFGMWGMGAFWVVALPALGGLVFGLAMIRTGGLALPLGLHLGGNWIQASVLRLGGPIEGAPSALFTAPLTSAQAQQLWSPDLLPHVPYLFVMLTAAILVAFRGSSRKPNRSVRPPALHRA
jgi:membrane protease YdiL (CAAX protease family)